MYCCISLLGFRRVAFNTVDTIPKVPPPKTEVPQSRTPIEKPLKPILKNSNSGLNRGSKRIEYNLKHVEMEENKKGDDENHLDEMLEYDEKELLESFDQYLLRLRRLQENAAIAQHMRDMRNGNYGPIEEKNYREKLDEQRVQLDSEEQEMRNEFWKLVDCLKRVGMAVGKYHCFGFIV